MKSLISGRYDGVAYRIMVISVQAEVPGQWMNHVPFSKTLCRTGLDVDQGRVCMW